MEPFNMPFRVHLHAADIDRMTGRCNCRLEMAHGGLAAIEKQALAGVIQRPCPGHELASDRLPAGLYPRDALQQAARNAMLRLGAACLGQADVLERTERLAGLCKRVGGKQARTRQAHSYGG